MQRMLEILIRTLDGTEAGKMTWSSIGDYAAFFLLRVLPYLSAIFLRIALR